METNRISEQEARAIGVDAYIYFYPLVTMDITRLQSTNVEAGKELGKGPMNTFVNVPAYPPADLKVVVRVNFDTLYSIAWLDLTKEAQIISAPDTSGRFYLLPMLDMWSDVFASPGSRTTGTRAGNFLVTPPGWNGTVPEGFTETYSPPTSEIFSPERLVVSIPPVLTRISSVPSGFTPKLAPVCCPTLFLVFGVSTTLLVPSGWSSVRTTIWPLSTTTWTLVFFPSSALALSRTVIMLLGRTTSVEPSAMLIRARPVA